LGGFENLQQKKVELRQEAGLSILTENPLQIVRDMKASTPPTNATDLLEVAQGRKKGKRVWLSTCRCIYTPNGRRGHGISRVCFWIRCRENAPTVSVKHVQQHRCG